MLPSKYSKPIAWACAAVLATALALLVALQLGPYAKGQTVEPLSAQEAIYYDGTADFAVALYAAPGPDRTALLSLLRDSFGAPVLLSAQASPTLPSLLAERAGLPLERVLVVGVDTLAPQGDEGVLGRIWVRPAFSSAELLAGEEALFLLGHSTETDGHAIKAVELYNTLSGDNIAYNGRSLRADRGAISLQLTPSAVLSDIAPSQALLDAFSSWVVRLTGAPVAASLFPSILTLLWLAASVSLLAGVFLLATLCRASYEGPTGVVTAEVKSRWLFFLGRAVLWLAALPAMGLCYLLFSLLSAPLGTGGRLLVSYVVGCSLSTGLLYRLGMLGIKGNPSDIRASSPPRGLLLSGGLLLTVLLTGGLLARTGFWGVAVTAGRGILFAGLWVVLSVGLLSVMHDALMLAEAARTEGGTIALLLIPYLPLAALAVFCVPMGLLPVGVALFKLTAGLLLSILLAKIIRELTGGALLAAVAGALPFSLLAAFQTYL